MPRGEGPRPLPPRAGGGCQAAAGCRGAGEEYADQQEFVVNVLLDGFKAEAAGYALRSTCDHLVTLPLFRIERL